MRRAVRLAVLAALGLALAGAPGRAADTTRLVSIGGAVTEIVYALGAGDRLVAVDTTSLYPAAARKLPNVGYMRQLSAEGVLSLRPSLVLITKDAGPPAALKQLGDAGTALQLVPDEPSAEGAAAKIRAVAEILGAGPKGARIAEALTRDLARLEQRIAPLKARPKVVFVLSIGQGAPLAAGRNTTADAMIRLAGGVNAIAGYEGYKLLSPEAAVAAAPDAILVTSHSVELLGGADAILARPELKLTPAGKAHRLIAMDGLYLLGFGPRLAFAVRDLAKALHPDLALPDPAAATETAGSR
jgi:iron complex transport system substrate-binding protein